MDWELGWGGGGISFSLWFDTDKSFIVNYVKEEVFVLKKRLWMFKIRNFSVQSIIVGFLFMSLWWHWLWCEINDSAGGIVVLNLRQLLESKPKPCLFYFAEIYSKRLNIIICNVYSWYPYSFIRDCMPFYKYIHIRTKNVSLSTSQCIPCKSYLFFSLRPKSV